LGSNADRDLLLLIQHWDVAVTAIVTAWPAREKKRKAPIVRVGKWLWR
jgi:hypothetical protein